MRLRKRCESSMRDNVPLARTDASLVLDVLNENEVLREQVSGFERLVGPAAVLPLVCRMLSAAGDLLRAVVATEGDSVDHLVTVVEHAAGRVEYERRALR